MHSERRGELHRHVVFDGAEHDAPPRARAQAITPAASGVSLLSLSVPARLLIVAVAAVLLWTAVLWALK